MSAFLSHVWESWEQAEAPRASRHQEGLFKFDFAFGVTKSLDVEHFLETHLAYYGNQSWVWVSVWEIIDNYRYSGFVSIAIGNILNCQLWNSLVVQWLGLCPSTAGGIGLIPGRGTNTLHAALCGWKRKFSTVAKNLVNNSILLMLSV